MDHPSSAREDRTCAKGKQPRVVLICDRAAAADRAHARTLRRHTVNAVDLVGTQQAGRGTQTHRDGASDAPGGGYLHTAAARLGSTHTCIHACPPKGIKRWYVCTRVLVLYSGAHRATVGTAHKCSPSQGCDGSVHPLRTRSREYSVWSTLVRQLPSSQPRTLPRSGPGHVTFAYTSSYCCSTTFLIHSSPKRKTRHTPPNFSCCGNSHLPVIQHHS